MTFKCKVVADTSNDTLTENMYGDSEPTYRHLADLISEDKCSVELVLSWDTDNEPTLIITEKKS